MAALGKTERYGHNVEYESEKMKWTILSQATGSSGRCRDFKGAGEIDGNFSQCKVQAHPKGCLS
jgi:hypothetical protein